MPRHHLTTSQRGYGRPHQRARAEALERAHPMQRCTRCGQPLGTLDPARLHLDHTDDRRGYRGLAHAKCNTSAGQAKAMAGRRARTQPARTTKRSRNW